MKQSPTPLTPRAAAPAAACVAGRSRGQHMLPQQPSKQTATAPRPFCVVCVVCVVPKLRACETIPHPPNPSCCRSCGGMRGWPLPRPTHAPATTLKTNGNSAPIKPMSFPSSAWECVLEDFVLQRLRKIFVGEVFAPLPIFRMGTRHHMFSLYCAIANPSENAVNAAGRIVNYLRKKINGGGKLSQKGNHVPVPH